MSVKAKALEGALLGPYRLRYKVAQGGMASVYLAQREGTHGFERWVAVKVIHSHLAEERRFVTMLLDEAHVASRIHHTNVCSVQDFGEHDGIPYLVMEYLHGESLSAAVRRLAAQGRPFSPWLAARIVENAARGLHAAHELHDVDGSFLSVVHRDVSPQNIVMLYDGVSKVLDFGIARARGRLTATAAGELKGKFGYMSPEQLEGGEIDRRSDVWALGVVLWETTVGKRLFRADAEGRTVWNVMNLPVPSPSETHPDFPRRLEDTIMSCLIRNPARRIQTAGELADRLEAYLYEKGWPAGPAKVSEWMHETFPDKHEMRLLMLSSTADATMEVAAVDLESQSSIVSHQRPAPGGPPPEPLPPVDTEIGGARDPDAPDTDRPGPPDAEDRAADTDPPEPSVVIAPNAVPMPYPPAPSAVDHPIATVPAPVAAAIEPPTEPGKPSNVHTAEVPALDADVLAAYGAVGDLPTQDTQVATVAPSFDDEPQTLENDPWTAAPVTAEAWVSAPGMQRKRRLLLLGGAGALAALLLLVSIAVGLSGDDDDAAVAATASSGPSAAPTKAAPLPPPPMPAPIAPLPTAPPPTTSMAGDNAATPTRPPRERERPSSVQRPSRPERPAPVQRPSRPERPAPMATDARGNGRLNVMSVPRATVYLRGRALGQTPLVNVQLPAGRHSLRVVPLGGGAGRTIVVEISPNRLTTKSVRFDR